MEDMDMFNCLDCGVNTSDCHEYYMVKDRLWMKANPLGDGMLCVGCLEHRIGRVLRKKDFTSAPLNSLGGWKQSERLIQRLTSK